MSKMTLFFGACDLFLILTLIIFNRPAPALPSLCPSLLPTNISYCQQVNITQDSANLTFQRIPYVALKQGPSLWFLSLGRPLYYNQTIECALYSYGDGQTLGLVCPPAPDDYPYALTMFFMLAYAGLCLSKASEVLPPRKPGSPRSALAGRQEVS